MLLLLALHCLSAFSYLHNLNFILCLHFDPSYHVKGYKGNLMLTFPNCSFHISLDTSFCSDKDAQNLEENFILPETGHSIK